MTVKRVLVIRDDIVLAVRAIRSCCRRQEVECWYCYWGLPKATSDIYDRAAAEIGEGGLNNGPAHVVWSDHNFDRNSVCWCISEAIKEVEKSHYGEPTREHSVLIHSLASLLLLPDRVLDPVPDDYDCEHPENYPPPKDIEWALRERA